MEGPERKARRILQHRIYTLTLPPNYGPAEAPASSKGLREPDVGDGGLRQRPLWTGSDPADSRRDKGDRRGRTAMRSRRLALEARTAGPGGNVWNFLGLVPALWEASAARGPREKTGPCKE